MIGLQKTGVKKKILTIVLDFKVCKRCTKRLKMQKHEPATDSGNENEDEFIITFD